MRALAGSWWFSPQKREGDVRPYLERAVESACAEPECRQYISSFDIGEPGRVNTFALFEDEAALAHHRAQPWFDAEWAKFRRDFGVDRIEVQQFEVAPLGVAVPSSAHGEDEAPDTRPATDMPLLLMGGFWRFAPSRKQDARVYQSWINACTRAHEPDCLMYLNDLDLFEENRMNGILLFRSEAGLQNHRGQKWVDPEYFRFAERAGAHDFSIMRYRARPVGARIPALAGLQSPEAGGA